MIKRIFLRSHDVSTNYVIELINPSLSIIFNNITNYKPNISEFPLSFTSIESLKSYIQCEINNLSYSPSYIECWRKDQFKNLDIIWYDADKTFSNTYNQDYSSFDIWNYILKCFMYKEMKMYYGYSEILDMYISYTGFWSRDYLTYEYDYDTFLLVSKQEIETIISLGIQFRGGYGSYIWVNNSDLNQIKLCVNSNLDTLWTVYKFYEIENKWQSYRY